MQDQNYFRYKIKHEIIPFLPIQSQNRPPIEANKNLKGYLFKFI